MERCVAVRASRLPSPAQSLGLARASSCGRVSLGLARAASALTLWFVARFSCSISRSRFRSCNRAYDSSMPSMSCRMRASSARTTRAFTALLASAASAWNLIRLALYCAEGGTRWHS